MTLALLALGALAGERFELTILHTNDLHGMLLPHQYTPAVPGFAVRLPGEVGGLARRATAIANARKEITYPLAVIDTGDVFTRGPWHTRFYGVPEIEALNAMGYDLLCVGNNELKATEKTDSQAIMLGLLRRSRFPWLAANLTVGETGVPVPGVQPFVVRDYGGVRVGYLGLTAPRAAEYPQTKGWTISDPIAAAKTWVPLARKECDILIAVTHIGVDLDRRLAAEVAGIDAIVGGDSHTYLPQPVPVKNPAGISVPIAQAGEQGVMLGRLDLVFEKAEGWALAESSGRLQPLTANIPEEPAMKALLQRWLAPEPVKVGRRWILPAAA
ncbi:MAG TPA: metallophosphatase [Armatimonadota bacterium]|nr:metallophosphatase [Armatimonadota bacterium]